MAIRKTLQIGDLALKASNAKITNFKSKELKQLIKDLTDTMHENKLIGMASPQLGENFLVFITEPRMTKYRTADQADDLRVYINPKIVSSSKEEVIIYEGCGSVLNAQLFGPVSRPKEVTIEAFDQDGKKFRYITDGVLARVIQHEYDHLLGIEFTQKVSDYSKLMSVDYYRERVANLDDQINNSVITLKKFEYI